MDAKLRSMLTKLGTSRHQNPTRTGRFTGQLTLTNMGVRSLVPWTRLTQTVPWPLGRRRHQCFLPGKIVNPPNVAK
eukprot:10844798-Karenia_brevis.AAC.1